MSTPAPVRARQSYRHEAFLWQGRADFVRALVPFIRDGIDAGEAVMVAVIPEHADWLRKDLGARASQVHFVDMSRLGRNPARIIPAWHRFLEDWCGDGRPARGIGEPIWPGRRPEEILECQLHEALLNLAVDPELPFWLVCPYDAEHLDSEVIAEAGRSHPALATAASYHGSQSYRGHAHAQEMFTAELPAICGRPTETTVTVSEPGSGSGVRLTPSSLRRSVVRPGHRSHRRRPWAQHQQPAPGRRAGTCSALEQTRGADLRHHRRHRDRRLLDRSTRTGDRRAGVPLVRQPNVRPRTGPVKQKRNHHTAPPAEVTSAASHSEGCLS